MSNSSTDLVRLLRFEILDQRNGGRAACDLLMGKATDALERAEREIAEVRADAAETIAHWGAYATTAWHTQVFGRGLPNQPDGKQI